MTTTTARPPSQVHCVEPSRVARALTRVGNAVLVRPLLRSRWGRRMRGLCLLEVTGRRSGRRYEIPVQIHGVDDGAAILTASAWRTNLRGGTDVHLTWRGERRPWRAILVEEPQEVAHLYERLLADVGVHGARSLGLRVDGAWPTHGDLVAALDARHSAIVLNPIDLPGD